MGEDLTTNCVVTINGGVDILTGNTKYDPEPTAMSFFLDGKCTQLYFLGYNNGHSGNKIVLRGNKKDSKDGISERLDFSRKDGWIKCSWKRKALIKIGKFPSTAVKTC